MTKPPPAKGLPRRLDTDASQPIYLQLAEALTKAIRAGHLPIGSRLPSEREYAAQLGLSRTTVTAAYRELKSAALVRGLVGSGAVVIADDPDALPTGSIAWHHLASRLVDPLPARRPTAADLIDFGDGRLHPSLVPTAALADCALMATTQSDALTHAAPIVGLPALREALANLLREQKMLHSSDALLVTGGALQGINLVARALIAPGECVVCEAPTWQGAFRAFRSTGADVVGVRMDRDGIDPDALEDALIRRRPKLVYLIPSFQCPTGRVLSLARRRRVLDICVRLRTPILESHVYGDLGFDHAPPSLKQLDTHGIVLQQGSASKAISPALRLGWLAGPASAMPMFTAAKALLDLSTPTLPQAILAAFLAGTAYPKHRITLRKNLRLRCAALVAALREHCPEMHVAMPQGGYYLWATLPQGVGAGDFETMALKEGVAIRAGDLFQPDGAASSHVRLCYAAPAFEQIESGAKRLGKALRNALQRRRDAVPSAAEFASV